MKLLCFFGIHVRKGWLFVGSSWNPDIYIRVCRDCGRQVYDKKEAEGEK
jgi:hypothetical protein